MISRLLTAAVLLWGSACAAQIQVIDAASGAPIPRAQVVADGRLLITDDKGDIDVDGSGTGFVRAIGYRAGSVDLAQGGVVRLASFAPHAVYISWRGAGSSVLLGNAFKLADAGGINAMVIDVKSDVGLIGYPSANPLAQADGARSVTTVKNLAALVAQLHARHLYAIARIAAFKDGQLSAFKPEWAVKRADGTLYRDREKVGWTDPFHPEVRQYVISFAIEAAKAGFDEIQFDYVRFPDATAKLVFSHATDEASRVAVIAEFLKEARQALLPYNVYISADIFGYVCWNANDTGIGQHLDEIAANVDYLSPMLYPSGFQYGIPDYRDPVQHPYEIITKSLDKADSRIHISPKRFRPWLQAFKDYAFDHRSFDAPMVAIEIKAANDFGSDGWLLWNPRNDYSLTGLGAHAVAIRHQAASGPVSAQAALPALPQHS